MELLERYLYSTGLSPGAPTLVSPWLPPRQGGVSLLTLAPPQVPLSLCLPQGSEIADPSVTNIPDPTKSTLRAGAASFFSEPPQAPVLGLETCSLNGCM